MLDAPLDVDGVARLSVDVAFGGMWYCIADASALGFAIAADEARELCEAGERIRLAAKEQLDASVSIVQIAQPWQGVGAVSRNAVVIAPGRLDRSATGTGLSARMAALHARGLMGVGDSMTHASPMALRAVRRRARPVPGGLPRQRHVARQRPAIASAVANRSCAVCADQRFTGSPSLTIANA
jgi:proline racemase